MCYARVRTTVFKAVECSFCGDLPRSTACPGASRGPRCQGSSVTSLLVPANSYEDQGRRQWRKVHLAMDTATTDIRAVEITPSSDGDSLVLPELLE